MKIIVSDEADDDLLLIFSYLDRNSMQAAESVAAEFDRCFTNISLFPFSGVARPHLGTDIRSAVVFPYVVLYAVRPEHITILRIFHGSRYIEAEFNQ